MRYLVLLIAEAEADAAALAVLVTTSGAFSTTVQPPCGLLKIGRVTMASLVPPRSLRAVY